MRSRSEVIEQLLQPGLIAVVRAGSAAQVPPIAEALVAGGFRAIEVTLTVPDALTAIRETAARVGCRAVVGVGTVLKADQAAAAIDAGAEFVVSPITRAEIVGAAHAADRPVMLGAYTPTEAQAAYEAGADFIKLFPADKLGPAYVKALRAPLPHLRIVPTGGVDLDTAAAFLRAGCAALGVGSALLRPEILKAGDWAALTRLAMAFVEVVRPVARGKFG
ncbi:MAG TPA: bifunctional 4-hydroxy-2-oxoglutarate aldolase/2-dehydro-3-deoxy-phosphogluconate aldolase [Methylomirabilota bacterium]|nr:bifunctional 4-hydroxy-2-oxoglutarate aldolase/2-dehydro-3-deoxy-phosphogluconate aldolase [Methylomirabilota bacterium]